MARGNSNVPPTTTRAGKKAGGSKRGLKAGKFTLRDTIRSPREGGLKQDLVSHSSTTRTAMWATTTSPPRPPRPGEYTDTLNTLKDRERDRESSDRLGDSSIRLWLFALYHGPCLIKRTNAM